jgi:hypothetical protein
VESRAAFAFALTFPFQLSPFPFNAGPSIRNFRSNGSKTPANGFAVPPLYWSYLEKALPVVAPAQWEM